MLKKMHWEWPDDQGRLDGTCLVGSYTLWVIRCPHKPHISSVNLSFLICKMERIAALRSRALLLYLEVTHH